MKNIDGEINHAVASIKALFNIIFLGSPLFSLPT